MRDLNKVMLIGNLTRDPELRTTNSGQTVASFAVATNRSWNDAQGVRQDAVEYIDIVAWGKLAEIVGQIYRKGRRTYVEGRLQTRNWEAQDGTKRYKTEVVASDLILLDKAPAGEVAPLQNNAGNTEGHPTSQTAEQPVAAATTDPLATAADEINIEDIPF
ncbi:MAG: single-stranded DNA-binding protein [Patescibacteria group bacterium]|jgi:single-strand DNA-binding protein